MLREAAIRKHTKMDTSSASATPTEPSPGLWSVERLKSYLKEKELPVSGRKNELIKRVADFQETEALEAELGVAAFQNLSVTPSLPFESLPTSGWRSGELPQVTEEQAVKYLKQLGGFTKKYRTGVRSCQCGHVYDIEGAPWEKRTYVGKVCNRHREPEYYPPLLLKLLLGDYGSPVSAPLQWGITHEDVAIQAYATQMEQQVYLMVFSSAVTIRFLVPLLTVLCLVMAVRWA